MAKSERKKPFEPAGCYPITVDAWTLKCLYRLSGYQDRIDSGEFVSLYEEPGRPRADGEYSIQVYYGRKDDRLAMVRLQWFQKGQEITRSGVKEPKWMCLGSLSYHMHSGDETWQRLRRDLTNFLPKTTNQKVIRAKKRYGDWRRYKCVTFGPVEAIWRAWWFRSRPYSAYVACVVAVQFGWRRAWKAGKPVRAYVRRKLSGPRARALALA